MDDYSTYIYIYYEGTWRRSCFESVKRVRFQGATRSHANLLRSGSVPPLQRLCQEPVLRASWEKCVACTCCRASRPRTLEYTIVYRQSAKRDVIPYLHAGLKGVIGRTRGVITDGRGVILCLHAGLRSNRFG